MIHAGTHQELASILETFMTLCAANMHTCLNCMKLAKVQAPFIMVLICIKEIRIHCA